MIEKWPFIKKPFLNLLAALFLAGLFIYFSIFEIVRIEGTSMEPTLYHGDIVLAQKTSQVRLGEVVIIKGQSIAESLDSFPHDNSDLIKRVVAMPGDTLSMQNNKLYLNETSIEDRFSTHVEQEEDWIIELEQDEYFVLGENRAHSLDSRIFGPINKEDFKGRALFRILSPAQ